MRHSGTACRTRARTQHNGAGGRTESARAAAAQFTDVTKQRHPHASCIVVYACPLPADRDTVKQLTEPHPAPDPRLAPGPTARHGGRAIRRVDGIHHTQPGWIIHACNHGLIHWHCRSHRPTHITKLVAQERSDSGTCVCSGCADVPLCSRSGRGGLPSSHSAHSVSQHDSRA